MAHKYNLEPVQVSKVNTKYRRIVTALPVPESLPILKNLEKFEPVSMQGQPPIIWDRAEGIQVYDRWGNMWLDWSSCVLVSNVGHGRSEVVAAVEKVLKKSLLATYVFPHESRAELCERLVEVSPAGLDKVFLLTTGSEATENCIKLARTYGVKKGGRRKYVIVSFEGAFHGRTLGAQSIGGIPALKEWMVEIPKGFVQVPFPDPFVSADVSFAGFEKALAAQGVQPEDVAGVISESYQGRGPFFLPEDYAKSLAAWCKKHDVVLMMDEVQAGFGRTGKMFCFEHYGITPDLVACGKGISSSLPIAAVIGRSDIMDLYAPGSMTSTHSASPIPVAAAIENLKIMKEEKLVENAAKQGKVLEEGLAKLQARYSRNIGAMRCRGLVGGLLMVKPGTKDPDSDTAIKINEKCFQSGLLMFAPVGTGGACVKIAPPLCTPRDAIEDGLAVLSDACAAVLK